MNDIMDIAAFAIDYCKSRHTLDNIKLQGILYYIQAITLINLGMPCFEEKPIATSLGPIFPSVYNYYETYTEADFSHEKVKLSPIEKDIEIIIKMVCDKCGPIPSWTIMNYIKNSNSWRRIYSPYEKRTISNTAILEILKERKRKSRSQHHLSRRVPVSG